MKKLLFILLTLSMNTFAETPIEIGLNDLQDNIIYRTMLDLQSAYRNKNNRANMFINVLNKLNNHCKEYNDFEKNSLTLAHLKYVNTNFTLKAHDSTSGNINFLMIHFEENQFRKQIYSSNTNGPNIHGFHSIQKCKNNLYSIKKRNGFLYIKTKTLNNTFSNVLDYVGMINYYKIPASHISSVLKEETFDNCNTDYCTQISKEQYEEDLDLIESINCKKLEFFLHTANTHVSNIYQFHTNKNAKIWQTNRYIDNIAIPLFYDIFSKIDMGISVTYADIRNSITNAVREEQKYYNKKDKMFIIQN